MIGRGGAFGSSCAACSIWRPTFFKRSGQAPERSFPERRHFLGNRGLIAGQLRGEPASCSPIVAPRAVTMPSATTTAAMTGRNAADPEPSQQVHERCDHEGEQDREHDGQEHLPPDVQRTNTTAPTARSAGPRATAFAAARPRSGLGGAGVSRMNDIPDGRGRGPVLKRPRSVNDPRRFPPMGPFAPASNPRRRPHFRAVEAAQRCAGPSLRALARTARPDGPPSPGSCHPGFRSWNG